MSRSSELFRGIQSLRLVAALMVVVTHSTFYASERLSSKIGIWDNGTSGVDIFFVISGFVMFVSSAHLASERFGWREFIARRLIRIAPLYWLVTTLKLLVVLGASSLVINGKIDILYLVKSYLFIPAFNGDGRVEPLLGVGWTLIFEMFFYAVYAVILMARVNIVISLTMVLGLCAFLSFFRAEDWPAWTVYADLRVIEFLMGVYIAAWARGGAPRWLALVVVCAGAWALLVAPFGDGPLYVIFLRILPAAAIVWAVVNLEDYLGEYLPNWILFFGAASYSLYLIHPIVAPIGPLLLRRIGIYSGLLSVLFSISLSFGFSVILYRCVERPLARALSYKTARYWRATVLNKE